MLKFRETYILIFISFRKRDYVIFFYLYLIRKNIFLFVGIWIKVSRNGFFIRIIINVVIYELKRYNIYKLFLLLRVLYVFKLFNLFFLFVGI